MKAAVRTGLLGYQYVLQGDVAKPKFIPDSSAHRDHVLVRVHAGAINPVDYKLPRSIGGAILGIDFAGTIVEVGAAVQDVCVGDDVYGACSGSLAEYAIACSTQIAKRPSGTGTGTSWTMAECAALNVAYQSSLQALRKANVTPSTSSKDKSVLVIGASGGCGIAALQLCCAMNVARITAVCSGKNADFVKESVGTTTSIEVEVVDYTNKEELKRFFADNVGKYDCVLDAATGSGHGEDYWNKSKPLLKPSGEGKYVALNGPPVQWIRTLAGMPQKDQVIIMCQSNTADLESLMVLLDKIQVKPIVTTVPFTEQGLEDAFTGLKGRRTKGKIVFEI